MGEKSSGHCPGEGVLILEGEKESKREGGERESAGGGRESERERERIRAGDCTRKLFIKTIDKEKRKDYSTASFLINIGAQSQKFQRSGTLSGS